MNTEGADWAPTSCTLPTTERPLRVAEFDEFFATTLWHRRKLPTQLDIAIPAEVAPWGRDLAERESGCCSFFRFDFDALGADVVMHIGVPAAQAAVLDVLEAGVAAAMTGRGDEDGRSTTHPA